MGRNKPVRCKTTSDKTPRRFVAHGVGKKGLNIPPPQILAKHQYCFQSNRLDCEILPWQPSSVRARSRGLLSLSGHRLELRLHSKPIHTQHTFSSVVFSRATSKLGHGGNHPRQTGGGGEVGTKEGKRCPVQPIVTRKANGVLSMHQPHRMLLLLLIKPNPYTIGTHTDSAPGSLRP